MYTSKEHQSYEMEQQLQQQHQPQQHASPHGDVSEDTMDAATPNDDNNGVGGSLGSLGGPRMAAGDMLYDGHNSLSGKFEISQLNCRQFLTKKLALHLYFRFGILLVSLGFEVRI